MPVRLRGLFGLGKREKVAGSRTRQFLYGPQAPLDGAALPGRVFDGGRRLVELLVHLVQQAAELPELGLDRPQ